MRNNVSTVLRDLQLEENSPIPRGIPKRNVEDEKVVTQSPKPQKKRYRCPHCGRVVFSKKIADPQGDLDAKQAREAHERESLEAKEKMWSEQEERRRMHEKNRSDGREDGSE
jgi:ribosomal protein L14E/L6E/L27E